MTKTRHDERKVGSTVERKNISRLKFLFIMSLAVYGIIVYKLYHTQIIKHEYYSERYKEQSKKKITVYAPKGYIYDRKYSKLAENIGTNYAFGLNTRVAADKKDLAERVSRITGRDRYLEILNSKKGFVWLDNRLTEKERGDIYSVLTAEEKSAASFKSTANRIYPKRKLAGQIIGYTDIDGEGLSGVEKEFMQYLNGKDGWEFVHQDGRLNKYYGSEINKKDPVSGNSVVLTIDENYQAIAEEELEKAVIKWKAQKGVVVVMEPRSGEILAMSSYPDFDPNTPGEYDAFNRKNKVITDIYEPGSTFKTISAAVVLEEKKVDEEEVFFCSNAGYMIGKRKIKDSHENPNEYMSFRDVLAQSSNIGTLQAVSKIDKNRYFEYLRDFGFGNKTEIELTGEVKGYLPRVRDWSMTTQPTMSFGQGISVTPLQMITAYCAIANGGHLVKPLIVKGVIDKDNRIVKKYDTVKVRRVISGETSKRVRDMLRYAVTNGTGSGAEIEELKVAGKTGTSQKVENGQYSKRNYDASFIGMVPYDDPRIVCLVMLDSPRGCIYGGTVAAPVFKNIVKRIYDLDRSKTVVQAKTEIRSAVVPDLAGKKTAEAEKILKDLNIKYKVEKGTDTIAAQSVPPFSVIPEDELLIISGRESAFSGDLRLDITPEVTGLPVREAVKLLYSSGIDPVVVGSGNVYRQSALYTGGEYECGVCSLYCRLPSTVLKKTNKNVKKQL